MPKIKKSLFIITGNRKKFFSVAFDEEGFFRMPFLRKKSKIKPSLNFAFRALCPI